MSHVQCKRKGKQGYFLTRMPICGPRRLGFIKAKLRTVTIFLDLPSGGGGSSSSLGWGVWLTDDRASVGLLRILETFPGDSRGPYRATWVSDSALPDYFSHTVWSTGSMGINKESGKNGLHELIFRESLDFPREVNQIVLWFLQLNVSEVSICI